jgi:phosphate starvation-inducible PhoH-like protein
MARRNSVRVDNSSYTRSDSSPKFEFKSIFQRRVFKEIKQNHITALIGPAGSGKTLLSIYTAINLINNPESSIKKVIVVRSAEETMGESIGALPGEIEDKLYYAIAPIRDNLEEFCTESQIKRYLEENTIQVIPVSHLRGRSLSNTFIIVEEAQNLEDKALLTILTRLGLGSKMTFTADPHQADIRGRNGTIFLRKMLEDVEGCGVVHMPMVEVYRHPVLPNILERAAELRVSPN